MKKKKLSIIEKACGEVPGFSAEYKAMRRAISLAGKSQSTLTNYARCLAHMGLHFKENLLEFVSFAKAYTRIRHFGILASAKWKENKELVDQQLGALQNPQKTDKATQSLHRICPTCKLGSLTTVYTFDQRGPPERWIYKLKINQQKLNKNTPGQRS